MNSPDAINRAGIKQTLDHSGDVKSLYESIHEKEILFDGDYHGRGRSCNGIRASVGGSFAGQEKIGSTEVQGITFVGYTGGEGGRPRLWNLQSLCLVGYLLNLQPPPCLTAKAA